MSNLHTSHVKQKFGGTMLTKTLVLQITQVFSTFIEAITNCPKDQFPVSGAWYTSIAGIAMHSAGSVKDTFQDNEFQAKWSTPVSSRSECIAYIESCRDDLMLPYIESQDLLQRDAQPEYFISKLDRVMKILRHIAQHTGEINRLLRQADLPRGRFIIV